MKISNNFLTAIICMFLVTIGTSATAQFGQTRPAATTGGSAFGAGGEIIMDAAVLERQLDEINMNVQQLPDGLTANNGEFRMFKDLVSQAAAITVPDRNTQAGRHMTKERYAAINEAISTLGYLYRRARRLSTQGAYAASGINTVTKMAQMELDNIKAAVTRS